MVWATVTNVRYNVGKRAILNKTSADKADRWTSVVKGGKVMCGRGYLALLPNLITPSFQKHYATGKIVLHILHIEKFRYSSGCMCKEKSPPPLLPNLLKYF